MPVSATGMAIKTPVGPSSKYFASRKASGIWNNQNPNTFTQVGVQVSPAPLKVLISTIPIP